MHQIFGDFIENFPPDEDSLELTFTSSPRRIKQLWRTQLLSAYFAADYFVHFLATHEGSPEQNDRRIQETKGTVTYISNELLENAVKYNLETSSYKVKFGIRFLQSSEAIAAIFVTNSIDRARAEKFQAFIQELLSSDPEEFYIRQVEASVEDENSYSSGLGLLTTINDYQARLGYKFETIQLDPEIIAVTSMAQVVI